MYRELEQKFKVIYPESENATDSSLLNYSDDLNRPRQRWYRYKEGFSLELVEEKLFPDVILSVPLSHGHGWELKF